MKIEIKRDKRRTDPIRSGGVSYPANRGGFDIFVDGKLWGRTRAVTHGCHGSTHELRQVTAEGQDFAAVSIEKRGLGRQQERLGDRRSPIKIWSDKTYLRNLKPGESPLALQTRIEMMTADAIKAGWLRDPAVIAAEVHKADEKRRADEATCLQKKTLAWEARALKAIANTGYLPDKRIRDSLVDEIVKAMTWAQTQ